jgi:DNA-binding NarL/FixJ family response regulator
VIRIVVVDDHPIVREGLVTVLADQPDFEIAGAAGAAEEAVALVRRTRPDVVLLDLELPGIGGLEAIPQLREANAGTRVLVFTAYDTEERVLGALRAGAGGYLLKGASTEEIAGGIRAVHAGGSALEPRVAARLVAEVSRPARRGESLSGREQEVLRLVAEGLANKQIGRRLGISERTVKFHVASILRKLEADNRAQAVALAGQRGLLGEVPSPPGRG